MATRKDSNAAALSALELLGVDPATVNADVPPIGALVGHIDSPFSLVTPQGMEALADQSQGRVCRVVDEGQASRAEARGCHRIQDKRVHFKGFAPGSGIYLFQPKAVVDEAARQRKKIDADKQPRRPRRAAGQPIPLRTAEGGAAAATSHVESRWVPVGRPGGEG